MTEPIIKKAVPVVGLLVQGSPRGVDHVLTYLNDKMPVVILKGSGGVADLLAYAFEELVERWSILLFGPELMDGLVFFLLLKEEYCVTVVASIKITYKAYIIHP